jgi:hypothetical protein
MSDSITLVENGGEKISHYFVCENGLPNQQPIFAFNRSGCFY